MEQVLKILKAKLGISSTYRDEFLLAILKGLKQELEKIHGLEINTEDINHIMFLVDYGAWRYESKGEDGRMPENLYWRLKNLMIGGKDGTI